MATQKEKSHDGADKKKIAENKNKGLFQRVLAHFSLPAFCMVYLFFGSLLFQEIEISAAKRKALPIPSPNATLPTLQQFLEETEIWSVRSTILFSFVTITTIGYGNVSPKTLTGRIFCMFYGLIGIALFGICMADIARFTSKLCWKILWTLQKMGLYQRRDCYGAKTDKKPQADLPIPVWLILMIFLTWLFIGTWMFPWFEKINLFDSLYFTFISLTTVGYGDLYPKNLDWIFLTMLYLTVGTSINMVAIQAFAELLQKFHHIGQEVKDAAITRILLGGDEMQVEDLVSSVGKRLGADPGQIDMIMNNLDNIVSTTIAEKKEEAKRGKKRVKPPANVGVDIYVKNKDVVKKYSFQTATNAYDASTDTSSDIIKNIDAIVTETIATKKQEAKGGGKV